MRLECDGLPRIEFIQSSPNLTATSQNLPQLVQHDNLQLYADDQQRGHASHVVAIECAKCWKMSKQEAANKIKGIVALAPSSLRPARGSSKPLEILWAIRSWKSHAYRSRNTAPAAAWSKPSGHVVLGLYQAPSRRTRLRFAVLRLAPRRSAFPT